MTKRNGSYAFIAALPAVLLGGAIISGCQLSSKVGLMAAERNGKTEIPVVAEFVEMFPQSIHFISYYTGEYGPPTWNSKVGIYGRYVLSMQLRIDFDSTRRHIISYGDPEFTLVEIAGIQGSGVYYNTETQRGFDIEVWKQLYGSGGDLSSTGAEIIIDQPIPGFEKVWKDA